ncbi:MAG: hypothetical protein AAGU39_08380 [Sedimentibacter saalensis]|uniref:hypothetical protein n=1 Tax=Sedimentibacter saalensis TaxID=130788 RepID=UPI0031586A82
MGKFSKNTKGRAWIGTVQIANMEKAGLSKEEYENPELLAEFLSYSWSASGKGRVAGIAICVSAKGLYHAHVSLYGNLTTLGNVAKIMYDSHIEPQLGGKKELKGYLLKEPPYDENGEQVLYTKGMENIQDNKGKRTDIEEIADLLQQGFTPTEIMEENFAYRKYEKMIKSAYIDKRIKETPLIKDTHNEWHVGNSGSGKTYFYYQLCEKYTQEKIYMATDFENGGFDFYIEQGAPPILFLDEFKGNMRYSQLLTILDKYSRTQTHCRYTNTYNLWTTCIITSIFPPDEVYSSMVEDEKKHRDKIDQLLRRLDLIVYHYKQNGEYKTFSIPASEYINYDDLKRCALEADNRFIEIDDMEDNPFNS